MAEQKQPSLMKNWTARSKIKTFVPKAFLYFSAVTEAHKGMKARLVMPHYSGDLFSTRGDYTHGYMYLSRMCLHKGSPGEQRDDDDALVQLAYDSLLGLVSDAVGADAG